MQDPRGDHRTGDIAEIVPLMCTDENGVGHGMSAVLERPTVRRWQADAVRAAVERPVTADRSEGARGGVDRPPCRLSTGLRDTDTPDDTKAAEKPRQSRRE